MSGSRRFQVRLGDLATWVVGSAVFFALARGARGFWIDWITPRRLILDVDRAVGVALLAPATLIVLRLVRDAVRPGDRRRFAAAWRLSGVAFLAGMALLIAGMVRDESRPTTAPVFGRPQWGIKLGALGMAIGTIGVLLGVVPVRRPRASTTRRRWVAPSVILAGLAGVAVAGFWGESIIPYLVIIALDAVMHAKQAPALVPDIYRFGHAAPASFRDPTLWPSLDQRLAAAGLAAAVALVACGLAAHWLSRDLREPAEERGRPRSWPGVLYRLATAGAAWGIGAYLLFVALPRMYPPLEEGLWTLLGPTWRAAIVAPFVALAAGLSARGVAGPAEPRPAEAETSRSPWPSWVRPLAVGFVKLAIVVVLAMTILAAVAQLRGGVEGLPWWAPYPVAEILGAAMMPFEWTTTTAIYLDPKMTPDALVLLAATALLVVLAARFLLAPGAAPIDRIARDRCLVGRFLGAWLAMTGVMLALLPAFFLAGMATLHVTLKAYYR